MVLPVTERECDNALRMLSFAHGGPVHLGDQLKRCDCSVEKLEVPKDMRYLFQSKVQ
jgi:hypothetical protein